MSAPQYTEAEVERLWASYRSGAPTVCPADGANVALSIDGSRAYRLTCTQCGVGSSWFTSAQDGILVRVAMPPITR
jgi:hypothetical protein